MSLEPIDEPVIIGDLSPAERAMSKTVVIRDGWRRGVEKKLSRALDAHILEEGLSSKNDLAIKNDFFAALSLSGFRISAIGRQPISSDE
jgi:hypothetical protein